MKVLYTAPNRAHHYKYALAMHQAGVLGAFVSGFSRFSPRASLDEIGSNLYRADILQTIYLGSLKFRFPQKLTSYLAYVSKIEQDLVCRNNINDCDIFLFYSGSGLNTCLKTKEKGVLNIVEAVNSHVQYQEEILVEEHKLLNLPWLPFNKQEKARRIREYELADYILLPSNFVKKSFIDLGFPEHKLLKVPYGFDKLVSHVKKKNTEEEQGTFTVLYVGSISVRKGVRYLIEAFNKFEHPRKKLVIVGPRSEVDGLREQLLSPQIVFTGILKGEKLQEAYSNADIFCLPSIEEGLALVIGEALSFGLPIIATANTGASDIITDGQEGYIVPIRDSESILNRIQQLANDNNLFQLMKEAAKSKAQRLNGWNESCSLLLSTLLKLKKS